MIVVAFIFSILLTSGASANGIHKVFYYPNYHYPTYGEAEGEWSETFRSQWQLLELLRDNSNYNIIDEGTYLDWHLEPEEKMKRTKLFKDIAKFFPNGIPKQPNNLSEIQKEFLMRKGSHRILFVLGEIDRLYAGSNRELESNSFYAHFKKYCWPVLESSPLWLTTDMTISAWSQFYESRIRPWKQYVEKHWSDDCTLNDLLRENFVVERINEELPKDRPTLIIYGAGHDFENYFDKQDFYYLGHPKAIYGDLPANWLPKRIDF